MNLVNQPSKKDPNFRYHRFEDFFESENSSQATESKLNHEALKGDFFSTQNQNQCSSFTSVDLNKESNEKTLYLNESLGSFPQVEVTVDTNTKANVAIHKSGFETSHFCNDIITIRVKENSELNLVVHQKQPESVTQISRIVLEVEKNARANTTLIQDGSNKSQVRFESNCIGENAISKVHSLFVGKNKRYFDFWIQSRNLANRSLSEVDHWAILEDQSESVFNGNLIIPKGVLHSDGYHQNKNLLLSSSAVVHTAPKLEIETDEVSCAHGTSVSGLDPDQMYYLMSRGLDQTQAKEKLIRAFKVPALDLLEASTRAEIMKEFGVESDFEIVSNTEEKN